MDDAPLVCGFEGLRDLTRNGQRLVERKGTAADALRQVIPFDELHHERGGVTTLFKPVDLRDVRVIQRR
jgi:hypothetical protein